MISPHPDPSPSAEPHSAAPARPKWKPLVELAVGFALIMAVIWSPRPAQRWLYWAPVAWILLVSIASFPGRRAIGFQIAGLRRSLWVAGMALALACGAFWLAGDLGTLHAPSSPAMWVNTFLGYAIWSFVQQLLLQGFFLLRLVELLPRKTSAAFAAAGLFSLAHLPNPILTAMTLLWGSCACLVFLRNRNIYPLALSHAILGICVAVTIPAPTLHNMRVGLGYLRYRPPAHAHRSHSDHTQSTVAWVIAAAPTRRSARQARP